VQVHGVWPRGPYVQTHASVALALCTRRHGQSWHDWGNGDEKAEERRKDFRRRSSPCMVLMPQDGCHSWCFRGYQCCARCAAVRQGLRSLPGLQCVRAGLALVVSGARLPRRPCGSVLVPPGSAAGAAGAAPDACRPGWHSPSSALAWAESCRSWDITSPRRLAGVDITSVPLLTKPTGDATIRTGRSPGQYHGVIKSLRFALSCRLTVCNCPRDLSLSLLARVCT
jgi:hypothetical protein